MAKGQLRGNKEAKKPKKDKGPKAIAAAPSAAKSISAGTGKKK